MKLHLDLETRSTVDLRKCGVDVYARHPSTDVVVAQIFLDDTGAGGDGQWIEWRPGMRVPFTDRNTQHCLWVAHNFVFERALLQHVLGPRYGWPVPPLERWDCTMSRARACGLPGALDKVSTIMGAPFGKDAEGYALMLRMCRPRRLEADGTPVWWDEPEKVERLAAYCRQDVEAEIWLDRNLPQLTAAEREVWLADARLNERGVPLDLAFLDQAKEVRQQAAAFYDERMHAVTDGAVPKATNVAKLVRWLVGRGVQLHEEDHEALKDEDEDTLPELRRADVARLLKTIPPGPEREALQIRYEAGKSSVKKIDAMLRRHVAGRVRHNLAYHGAATGRWAATGGVQLQNLPRDGVADWDATRAVLAYGPEAVDTVEGPPLEILSRMLRGAILAPPGRDLIFADLAQVEARGVAWLAGQHDMVEAFATGRDLYCEMASRIFGRTITKKDERERWLGKTVVLGAGYGMGWPKFALTCAGYGRPVDDDLAELAITTYRETYAEIPRLWRALELAAKAAIRTPGRTIGACEGRIRFKVAGRWLLMELPSKRRIRYLDPHLAEDTDEDGIVREEIRYSGQDSRTKRWGIQKTYGGRLTENAVQGMCRDILAGALPRLEDAGYDPILLVHDEAINEVDEGFGSADEVVSILCQPLAWAPGFPVAAEGKRARRYRK